MSRSRGGWCKHYNGTARNEACEAGVKYADVTDTTTRPYSLPCIGESNKAGVTCAKCEFPTAEEVEADERERKERAERRMTIRQAIVAHLGGPWKRGTPGSSGSIPCPACKTGTVRFSRAGYNGHIHARCSTEGCASWME